MRAAIGSSYRALTDAGQAALSLAAAWVHDEIPAWALDELAAGDAKVVGKIVSVGLLTPAQAEVSGQRFRMHPLVRAYGRERTVDHGQSANGPAESEADAGRRLRAAWLRLADQAVARLPQMPFIARPASLTTASAPSATSGIDPDETWLDCERTNLLTAVAQAAGAGDYTAAGALASTLIGHQCITGAFADASNGWRAIAAAAARAGDARYQAIAEYYLSVALAESHERVNEAAALLAGALPELERAGEREIAAMAYALRARCASAAGRHAAAIRAARRAIRLAGPDGYLARCCATAVLGLTLARVGITQAGIDQCEQARGDARQLQEPAYEAYAIRALAQALMISGQYEASARACAYGIELARQYGSDIAAGRFWLLLGRARQCDGDCAAAAASLQAAADIFRAAADDRGSNGPQLARGVPYGGRRPRRGRGPGQGGDRDPGAARDRRRGRKVGCRCDREQACGRPATLVRNAAAHCRLSRLCSTCSSTSGSCVRRTGRRSRTIRYLPNGQGSIASLSRRITARPVTVSTVTLRIRHKLAGTGRVRELFHARTLARRRLPRPCRGVTAHNRGAARARPRYALFPAPVKAANRLV